MIGCCTHRGGGGLAAALVGGFQYLVPTVLAGLAIGIPAETLRQRPDVRAAEHAIKAAVDDYKKKHLN